MVSGRALMMQRSARDRWSIDTTHDHLGAVKGSGTLFRGLSIMYLAFAVLGPWINFGTVRGIRPEEIILAMLLIVYLVETHFEFRLSPSIRLVLIGLCAVAASICLSLLANIPRSGGGPVARDTLELVRVVKYAAAMVLAGYDTATAAACRKWFVALIVVAAALAFVQVMAPSAWVFRTMSAIDPSSAKFYASQNIAAGLRRVTGSFGNPNNFGVFLSASAGLLFGLLASSENRVRGWLLGIVLVAVCAAVVATQSFTDLAALAIVLVVGFLATLILPRYRRRALALFVVVAIIAVGLAGILGVFGHSSFVIGKRLTDARYALDTMNGRFKVWNSVAMSMADDPAMLALGMGPQKESETHVVGGDIDSDYVTILKRYGLIGFFCFGLFLILLVTGLVLPSAGSHTLQGWRFGALLMVLAVLVCDLTNVVYVNNQLMDVFMFVLGTILIDNRNPEERTSGFRNAASGAVGAGSDRVRPARTAGRR
jgi:O-antigen ligase